MEPEGGGDGGFSPRATVEDIQRRLLRPPSSLRSPPPTPSFSKYAQNRNPSQFGEAASKKIRKLEDYLDPVLLSAVSSKIGRAQKVRKIAVKREVRDFEWPVDELRMLMAEESPVGKEKIDSVNLGNDSDNLTDEDHGVDKFSTPFQKFEHTALLMSAACKPAGCHTTDGKNTFFFKGGL